MKDNNFQEKFCDRLKNISSKQVYYENRNIYRSSLRNEYTQLLDFCIKNKEQIMGREDLLSTIKCILKYNHRYVNNINLYKSQFNC